MPSEQPSVVIASSAKDCSLLAPRITAFRTWNLERARFLSTTSSVWYSTNAADLMYAMDMDYARENWCLFVDSTIASLKAVLLFNGSLHPGVFFAQAMGMKEICDTMEKVIELINYTNHEWGICGGFKVIGPLLGLQGGYTKHCYFLWLWDSLAVD